MRKTLLLVAAVVAGASAAPRAADIPNDAAAVEHALNRLAYGARPGDVEKVREVGLSAWIEQQLDPARIDD